MRDSNPERHKKHSRDIARLRIRHGLVDLTELDEKLDA